MFMCMAFFLGCLGYFQGDTKLMIGGAVAFVVLFVIGTPDVLGLVGFDGELIQDTMWGNRD